MLALVAGLQGIVAAGQGEGGTGKVVPIRFAHMWQEGASQEADMALEILNNLDEKNAAWEIKHEVVVGDEMRNKIRVDVAANNAPDMWQFWAGGVVADYAKKGIPLDLSVYLADSTRLKKEHIPQSAWDTCTYDGVIRALPRNISIGIFGANTELFEKHGVRYPETWSEFLATGDKFRANGVTPTNIDSKGGNPSHFWYGDLVCQYEDGPEATATIDETLDFTQRPFVKAAEYCEQMAAEGMFPDDVMANGDWDPSIAFYDQGNCAYVYTFAWCFDNMSPEMIEKTKLLPIPKLPDGERDPRHFIQGTVNDAYLMLASSWENETKREGMTLIMDAVAKDIAFALSQLGTIVSVDNEVMGRVDLDKIDNAMMRKAIAYRLENDVQTSPMIWQELPANKLQFDYQATLDELWAGAISAEEYIQKVQKSCDEWAEKNR